MATHCHCRKEPLRPRPCMLHVFWAGRCVPRDGGVLRHASPRHAQKAEQLIRTAGQGRAGRRIELHWSGRYPLVPAGTCSARPTSRDAGWITAARRRLEAAGLEAPGGTRRLENEGTLDARYDGTRGELQSYSSQTSSFHSFPTGRVREIMVRSSDRGVTAALGYQGYGGTCR